MNEEAYEGFFEIFFFGKSLIYIELLSEVKTSGPKDWSKKEQKEGEQNEENEDEQKEQNDDEQKEHIALSFLKIFLRRRVDLINPNACDLIWIVKCAMDLGINPLVYPKIDVQALRFHPTSLW